MSPSLIDGRNCPVHPPHTSQTLAAPCSKRRSRANEQSPDYGTGEGGGGGGGGGGQKQKSRRIRKVHVEVRDGGREGGTCVHSMMLY